MGGEDDVSVVGAVGVAQYDDVGGEVGELYAVVGGVPVELVDPDHGCGRLVGGGMG